MYVIVIDFDTDFVFIPFFFIHLILYSDTQKTISLFIYLYEIRMTTLQSEKFVKMPLFIAN